MTVEQAQRLSQLIHEHKRALRRIHSLERRIVKLLLAAPDDTALAASVLEHLEQELAAAYALCSARLFGASKGRDVDAMMEEQQAQGSGHAA